jgi:gamma-glutamylcyclotransferase
MRYFAYGSNLSKQQMKHRCPDSKPLFTATLPNYRRVITGWDRQWRGGVATIMRANGEKVRGGVYEISDADLRKLDKYESTYSRQTVTVYDEDSTPHEVLTYVKNGQLEPSRPSQAYADVVRQGHKDWGIV